MTGNGWPSAHGVAALVRLGLGEGWLCSRGSQGWFWITGKQRSGGEVGTRGWGQWGMVWLPGAGWCGLRCGVVVWSVVQSGLDGGSAVWTRGDQAGSLGKIISGARGGKEKKGRPETEMETQPRAGRDAFAAGVSRRWRELLS